MRPVICCAQGEKALRGARVSFALRAGWRFVSLQIVLDDDPGRLNPAFLRPRAGARA
jgi:hypothetical protein